MSLRGVRNPFGRPESGSESSRSDGEPSWKSQDVSLLSLHNPFDSSEEDNLRQNRRKSRADSSLTFGSASDQGQEAAAGDDNGLPLPAASRLKRLKERQAQERQAKENRLEYERVRSRMVHGRRVSPIQLSDVRQNITWSSFAHCVCIVLSWLFNCCGQGRRCSRKQKAWWLVIITMVLTFITTVFVCLEMYKAGAEPHLLAWFSGGVCVVLAVPISVFEIFWHLVYFSNPSLQKYIIRILWMVPIYGIESWFALRNTDHAIYLQAMREFYEAFVIWSFLQFLCKFLGNHDEEILNLMARKREPVAIDHLPPFCCLRRWQYGSEFLYRCKLGVLQYVVAKIATTVVTVIAAKHGVYHEGSFDLRYAYPYVAFIDNCSQLWALYCLAMFYQGLKNELAPIKPFSKFLSVKAIVFFSWWQGFGIQIAVSTGYITHTAFYTKENVATALQNWLICLEMLAFAIAHKYAFSYKEYVDVRDPTAKNFLTALFDSSVPVDFLVDMKTFAHKFEPVVANDEDAESGSVPVSSDSARNRHTSNPSVQDSTSASGMNVNEMDEQYNHFGLDGDGFSESSSDAGSTDRFLFGNAPAI